MLKAGRISHRRGGSAMDHDNQKPAAATAFLHLRAVVFDWAGTLVDHGSRAPMGAFVETFADFGVDISIDEARGPMGMAKRCHIETLLLQPRIAAAWAEAHGNTPNSRDIDALYDAFLPRNIAVAADHSELIAGAAETVARLRRDGLKIGSTTGYTREIMAEIVPCAARQGLVVDALACAGDTPHGRPAPLMMWRVLSELEIWPTARVVKIDDTPVGVQEGLNAGAWSVGVAVSGNAFGCSKPELDALPHEEYARRRDRAIAHLKESGAHAVIDSVADLLPVMHDLDRRAAAGERP